MENKNALLPMWVAVSVGFLVAVVALIMFDVVSEGSLGDVDMAGVVALHILFWIPSAWLLQKERSPQTTRVPVSQLSDSDSDKAGH